MSSFYFHVFFVFFLFQVGWVKADTKAIQAIHEHVITHNPRVSVSHSDQTTWNLHIRSVQEEDRGQYMCQINTDPMKSQVRLFIASSKKLGLKLYVLAQILCRWKCKVSNGNFVNLYSSL